MYDTWNFSGDLFCDIAETGVTTKWGNTANAYASYLNNYMEGRMFETRNQENLPRTRDLTVQDYGFWFCELRSSLRRGLGCFWWIPREQARRKLPAISSNQLVFLRPLFQERPLLLKAMSSGVAVSHSGTSIGTSRQCSRHPRVLGGRNSMQFRNISLR